MYRKTAVDYKILAILEEPMRARCTDYCQHIIYVSLHQILVNNYRHGNPLLWSSRIALA